MRNLHFKNLEQGKVQNLLGRVNDIGTGYVTYTHMTKKTKWSLVSEKRRKEIRIALTKDETYLEGRGIFIRLSTDDNGFPMIKIRLHDVTFYSKV